MKQFCEAVEAVGSYILKKNKKMSTNYSSAMVRYGKSTRPTKSSRAPAEGVHL